MVAQQVISTLVSINAAKQVRYFQIRLPRNATRIIGIEHGIHIKGAYTMPVHPSTFVQSLDFIHSRHIGTLRLQHIGKAGLFYAASIKEKDEHVGFGDYSVLASYIPATFTHGLAGEFDPVIVPRQAPLILGMFQDETPAGMIVPLDYQVIIHTWFDTQIPESV